MVVTTAEQRAINQTSAGEKSVHGRVTPKYITCAEPSPDVAKAMSTAFNASASGGVTLPNGVTADVAAAVSRARAEALVQLGERLATIQLLRDGLHSACEAYANGAITDTTYAVMLSRFDKTMVTMLVSELAAGAFGRSLAAAGAGSEGHASASADLSAKITKSRELEQDLKNAQDAQNAAVQDAAAAKTPEAQKTAQEKVDSTRKDVQKKEGDYKNALKASADSAANVSHLTAGGGVTASNNPEIAKTLFEIQRKYIENLNFDALEVACVSALDRSLNDTSVRAAAEAYEAAIAALGNNPAGRATAANAAKAMATTAQGASMTPLAAYCLTDLLPTIQKAKSTLMDLVITEAWVQKDNAKTRADAQKDMTSSISALRDYVTATTDLMEKVKTLTGKAATPPDK